jgi:hypothetical protein
MKTTSYLKGGFVKPKFKMHGTIGALFITYALFPGHGFCQNAFETAFNQKIDSLLTADSTNSPKHPLSPNDALGSVMTPSGFGGSGTCIFGGLAGIYPQVYSHKPDLITNGGLCIGDPVKAVNFAASVNMTNVHKLDDFSENFVLSRVVFTGSSISAGALQVFASRRQSDAPGATFYLAFSHAVQITPSVTAGASALTYTIGIGNDRFYGKSPADIAAGKGKYGTAVFGSISYEIRKHLNLNAEWTGQNLASSIGLRPFKNSLSLGLGVTNLTAYSADKPGMVFSFGYPLSLTK